MKKIEFKLPDSFSPPDGISKNGQFETLATVQLKEDGKACLVALDGYRMPGYQEGDDKDDKTYAQAASAGMEGSY